MKVYACFLLFTIFENSLTTAEYKPTENHRSVNLALETILEFSNKDNGADIKFLDNIQNFITRVKSFIDKNQQTRRDFSRTSDVETFTDFIQQVIGIINLYEDTAFQDFFDILDEEIRKYHYRGCKFYELTENQEIRRLIASKLDAIRGKPIFIIKAYINVVADILRDGIYDRITQEFVDYINSLYRQNGKQKFEKALSDLEKYGQIKTKRNNNDLVKIIREAVRAIIFDHYTDLNPNARRELRDKIDNFWKNLKQPVMQNAGNVIPILNIIEDKNSIKNNLVSVAKNSEMVPKNLNLPKEINKREAHDKDRIDEKNVDFKKTGKMRVGNKDSDEEFGKITKTVSSGELFGEKKHKHKRKTKHTSAGSDSSLEESLTGETFERNSIDLDLEQQKMINKQRYLTLYPEPLNYRPSEENTERIVHRSVTMTKIPKFQTLWVEKVTGRYPKDLRESLTSTHRPKHHLNRDKHRVTHGVKHDTHHHDKKHKKHDNHGHHDNKHHSYVHHESKHKPHHDSKHGKHHSSKHDSKHGNYHDTKHHTISKHEKHHQHGKLVTHPEFNSASLSKEGIKHGSKHKIKKHDHYKTDKHYTSDEGKVFGANYAGVRSTNMELYEYKKMMSPPRIDNKQENSPAAEDTKLSEVTSKKPIGMFKPTVPKSPLTTKSIMIPRISVKTTRPHTYDTSTPPVPEVQSYKKNNLTPPPQKYNEILFGKAYNMNFRSNLKTSVPVPQNNNEVLFGKAYSNYRKLGPLPFSNEGLSIEEFKREQAAENAKKSNNTGVIDRNVFKKIEELEKEIKEVKNKFDDDKTDLTTVKKITDKYKFKSLLEKSKKSKVNPKNSIKISAKDIISRKDKFKLIDTADNGPKYKTELKFVKTKDSGFKEVKIDSNVTIEEINNNNNNQISLKHYFKHQHRKRNETKPSKNFKLVNVDFDNEKQLKNYDEIDEWKGAFKLNGKTTKISKLSVFNVTADIVTANREIFIPITLKTTSLKPKGNKTETETKTDGQTSKNTPQTAKTNSDATVDNKKRITIENFVSIETVKTEKVPNAIKSDTELTSTTNTKLPSSKDGFVNVTAKTEAGPAEGVEKGLDIIP